MKINQPIHRGKQTDSGNIAIKHGESRRTNKHVTDTSNIEHTTNSNSHQVNHIAQSASVVCDGLNLTVHLDQHEQLEFKDRLSKHKSELVLRNARKMNPYRQGRFIFDKDKNIGTIQFDPFCDNAGYIFLHVNPSKLDSTQSYLIQELMSELLDEPWFSFVGRAKVSMFDAAVDIQGVNIETIIPIPSGAVQSGSFLKFFREGHTRLYKQGTAYLGHNKSEKNAVVYDKAEEQSEQIGVEGNGDTTRVEVQAKPRNRSRFGQEVSSLATLPYYPNPLRMLSIAEFQKDHDRDDLLKIASVLTAYIGSTAVLQLVADKLVQKRIRNHISAPPCSWWKPDDHWAEFLRGLASHPLFLSCNLLDEQAYVKFFAS